MIKEEGDDRSGRSEKKTPKKNMAVRKDHKHERESRREIISKAVRERKREREEKAYQALLYHVT
jgi:hypothetical protein